MLKIGTSFKNFPPPHLFWFSCHNIDLQSDFCPAILCLIRLFVFLYHQYIVISYLLQISSKKSLRPLFRTPVHNPILTCSHFPSPLSKIFKHLETILGIPLPLLFSPKNAPPPPQRTSKRGSHNESLPAAATSASGPQSRQYDRTPRYRIWRAPSIIN